MSFEVVIGGWEQKRPNAEVATALNLILTSGLL
jgi:hypothetical protein